LVLDSAAVSYGQATPYSPVLDLLRRYCHLEEHEDARTIQAKVTEQVQTLDAALHDTIPALLALLDALPEDSPFLRLDAPQRRQRTLAALKMVFLRQSQVQPLLLVCEDLHWLDTETQALLESVSESLPTARLLLLVNYRPDYRHGWGSKTYYTQVRLDPLPPASADAFLRVLLGDDPSLTPLTQLLIQRTEGNPFFLEESVRALVETGALVGEPGAYRMAQALPTMQVPATVQAVLAARIDRLPPEEKRLLQTAAVMGTEVPLPLLQAVGELPDEALRLSLTHLRDAEFLYEASLFPELVYTFKHAHTQEVAYGSLLQERRRVLRIAEVVHHPGSLMLAYRGLGMLSLRQGDLPRAIPRLEQALSICQDADLPGYFPLLAAGLGTAYIWGGRVADAVPLLTQAIEQAMATEMVRYQGWCQRSLGEAQLVAGRLEEAHALAERALALARVHEERGHQADVLCLLGDIATRREPPECEQAEASYQQALALADELGMRPLQAHCHRGLGTLYSRAGRAQQARAALSTAIALYRAMEMTLWLPQAEAALAHLEAASAPQAG
jgi:tetratricopeptide (TPR) repeat protein